MSGTSKLVENVHGAQSVVAVNVSDHGGWITCIYCMSVITVGGSHVYIVCQ